MVQICLIVELLVVQAICRLTYKLRDSWLNNKPLLAHEWQTSKVRYSDVCYSYVCY